MTRKWVILFFFLMIFVFGMHGKSFFFEAQGNLLLPGDGFFRDSYSSTLIVPVLKGGYAFTKDIYIFTGFSFFSVDGETPVLAIHCESRQSNLFFGAGYQGNISRVLHYRFELGGNRVCYEEKAFGMKQIDGSRLGFLGGAGLVYDLSKRYYASLNAVYNQVSDQYEGTGFKLGGLNMSLGLGIRF